MSGAKPRAGVVVLLVVALLGLAACGDAPQETPATSRRVSAPATKGRSLDYSSSPALNAKASNAALALQGPLGRMRGFTYLRIVPTGLEVARTSAGQAIPARARQLDARSGVPLSFRIVRYDDRQLEAVTRRLGQDRPELLRADIHLMGWGPDPDTNTVRIDLNPYTVSAAARLVARYGDIVSVVPRSVTGGASS